MRNNIGVSGVWCFMIGMILTGCASTLSPEVQQAVSDARANFQVVESLEVKDKFPNDYDEAHGKLVEAEKYLESSSDQKKAYSPAKQSLNASQRILKQFYSSTITPLARAAKNEIEKITQEDPDNPLKEFIPKLNDLLDYSAQLESGQQLIALNRVIEDLNEVINIKHNADMNSNAVLPSDVSFDSGKYDLSENGENLLKKFFEGVIAEQRAYLSQYTGKTVTMKVTVLGYTDQQGFRKGTELVKTLLQGIENQLPQEPTEQRKFLNQRLSWRRANTIGEYIQQIITQADTRIYVEQDIVGRGEELPPGNSTMYSSSDSSADPQRRICKIYSSIIVK